MLHVFVCVLKTTKDDIIFVIRSYYLRQIQNNHMDHHPHHYGHHIDRGMSLNPSYNSMMPGSYPGNNNCCPFQNLGANFSFFLFISSQLVHIKKSQQKIPTVLWMRKQVPIEQMHQCQSNRSKQSRIQSLHLKSAAGRRKFYQNRQGI